MRLHRRSPLSRASRASRRLRICAVGLSCLTLLVGPAAGQGPTITLSQEQFQLDEEIRATLVDPPGGPLDWVALAPVGAGAGSYLDWKYVKDLTGDPKTWTPKPQPTGQYEVRLFLDNGFELAATSGPFTVVEQVARTAGSWTRKANLAQSTQSPSGRGRFGAVAFSIDRRGYLGTGNDGAATNDFWELDPIADTWTKKAPLPGNPREYAVGFAIGGKGYIGLGAGTNDFYEYDPTNNVWIKRTDFPGTSRSNAVGFAIGGKGYVGTGGPGLGDFWEYDPAKETGNPTTWVNPGQSPWRRRADLGAPGPVELRRCAIGFGIGEKGYVGTGYDNTLRNARADFWEYDPHADEDGDPATHPWTRKADFPGGGMCWGTGFGTASKGYAFEPTSGSFYEYDPTADEWTKKRSPVGAKKGNSAVSFAIGNKGYYGTGYDYTYIADFWEYAIETLGPIHYWPEASGRDWVGIADAILGSISAVDTDRLGATFSFDGTQSAVVTLPVDINPETYPQLTLGMRVKLRSKPSDRGWILSHDDGGHGRSLIVYDERYGFGVATGAAAPYPSTLVKPADDLAPWRCLAVVFDAESSQAAVYADGEVQVVETRHSTGLRQTTLGGLPILPGHTVDALVDGVFIFDSFLSTEQIDNACSYGQGTILRYPDLITSTDPTSFVDITSVGQEPRDMFDRRLGADGDFASFRAFLFEAAFDDGRSIEIQVNPEFGSVEAAQVEARNYAEVIGRLPAALRADVATVWIHRGNESFGGGNSNLLIHTERGAEYSADNILEETLAHEASHTSLDGGHATAPEWLAAQRADGLCLSAYACQHPAREDIAESFVSYLAVAHRPDRISPRELAAIRQTIPNRIDYFDRQGFDLYPLVPRP